MPTLLAVSPHLDDAAFSAGGTLAQKAKEGWRVIVATCFTGNVVAPKGFALACQTDKGIDPSVDYMALRRHEDEIACDALGARAIHLPFLEAPHRGYGSAAALFAQRFANDVIQSQLETALAELTGDVVPDLVYGPLALGNHVDHWVVQDALKALDLRAPLYLWEDWPYVDRESNDPLAGVPFITTHLNSVDIGAKIAACLAYKSQLGFQFGSASAMTARLDARSSERFAIQP